MRKGFVGLVKLLMAVVILPIVIGVTVSLIREVRDLGNLHTAFVWGIWAYTVAHLFFFTPQSFYHFTQRVFAEMFRFSSSFASTVPLAVPLWTVLTLLVLYICSLLFATQHVRFYFMLLTGFSLAMHIILTAQELFDEDGHALKPHYFLTMSLAYVANMVVVALLLGLNFNAFSISVFFESAAAVARDLYTLVFRYIP